MKLALNLGKKDVLIENYSIQVSSSIEKVSVPNETYDLVFAPNVLEYVKRENIYCVLKEWRRIIKLGGFLQIIVPDIELACIEVLSCLTTPATWDALYGEPTNPVYCGYTHQSLKALVEKYGFTINVLECKDRNIHLTATKISGWIE